jgi:hypothetical protein
LNETQSDKTEEAKEERIEIHPSLDRKMKTHTHAHTHTHTIKFFQINLHHSKAATATVCQQPAEGTADIALIQEPRLYKGQIRGLNNIGGTVYSVAPENNVRSVFISGVILMPYICWSSVPGTQQW